MIKYYTYFCNVDLTARIWKVGRKFYRQTIPVDGMTKDTCQSISKKKFYKIKKYYTGHTASGFVEV